MRMARCTPRNSTVSALVPQYLLVWNLTAVFALQDQEQETVWELFEAIRHSANDMARVDARPLRKATCTKIIDAARRAEKLLHPLLRVEVYPEEMAPDAAESAAFTHPTVPSHPDARLAGTVTKVTWSETRTQGTTQGEAQLADLPEKNFGGGTETKMQEMEHTLLELQNKHRNRSHPDIAATVHALGLLSREAGDLIHAKLRLEESLRMKRSFHGDRDHPDIAATLHELGLVSRQAGDLYHAELQLEVSLRMKRSFHGDRDHPDIAATLHELGLVSRQAGDLTQAKQQLQDRQCLA